MQAQYALGSIERERKLVAGVDGYFWWAPQSGRIDAVPTLSVQWPAGTQAYGMVEGRAEDEITAISADRRTLTVTWGADGPPTDLLAEVSPVVIRSDTGGAVIAARIQRVLTDTGAAGTLALAEPLPHAVAIVSGCLLDWLLFYAVIPAGHIGTSALRHVRWSLAHGPQIGGVIPSIARAQGLLHVVKAAFDTGLSDGALVALIPALAQMVPAGQSTWGLQRRIAEEQLVSEIRGRLPAGSYEDDVAGPQFLLAHAYLSAALAQDGRAAMGVEGAQAGADAMRARAADEIDRCFRRLSWVDADRDGVVDESETDIAQRSLAGLGASHVTNAAVFLDDSVDVEEYDRAGSQEDR